uniref:Uncharacterized protein n=1 Tax=Anguilla anguilla TaxID=7936 RepID=A0A0E9TUN2_ANGAN
MHGNALVWVTSVPVLKELLENDPLSALGKDLHLCFHLGIVHLLDEVISHL